MERGSDITQLDREYAKEVLNYIYKGTITITYASDQLVMLTAKMLHEMGECSSTMNLVNFVFDLFTGNIQGKINALNLLRNAGKTLRRDGKLYSSCIVVVKAKYRTEVMSNM